MWFKPQPKGKNKMSFHHPNKMWYGNRNHLTCRQMEYVVFLAHPTFYNICMCSFARNCYIVVHPGGPSSPQVHNVLHLMILSILILRAWRKGSFNFMWRAQCFPLLKSLPRAFFRQHMELGALQEGHPHWLAGSQTWGWWESISSLRV